MNRARVWIRWLAHALGLALLIFVLTALLPFFAGYKWAEHDVARHWATRCLERWRDENFCAYQLEHELGVPNRWTEWFRPEAP